VARDAFPPVWFREHGAAFWQRMAAASQRVWRTAAPASSRSLQIVKDTGKKTVDRLRATPWQTLAYRHWKLLLLGIGIVFLVIVIWKVPQWQAAGWQGLEAKDLAKLQNDARTTLVQALGGAFLLIGLYLTFRNLQLTQDKQITEHYTRAVEQLGSDKLAVRLGAIYALERIARDSERDHWPIMEILTAYVRERAPIGADLPPEEKHQPNDTPPPHLKPAIDIQAVLTVLGRRTRTYGKGENQPLDLARTNLQGADLWGAHLEGAILVGANLERAGLMDAHLEGAFIWSARLKGAILMGANLERADLTRTLNITVETLAPVSTLYQAHLDPSLREQVQQKYPYLLEKGGIFSESS
jgi:hypothetical protein